MDTIRALFTILTGLVGLVGYIAANPTGIPAVVSFSIGAAAASAIIFGIELLYKRS